MSAVSPEDVAARLAALYADRAGAMREIGIAHDGLEIATYGFRLLDGHVTGIVLTPWFMNLVRLPGETPLPDAAEGGTVAYAYPAGEIAFTVGSLSGIGRIDAVSLFSPMFEFADHGAAEATALASLDELFRAPIAAPEARPEPVPSRRALLFGRGDAAP